MLATKFEKVFTQGTCISFQNIIIEISENMLFFAAFLGKPVKVNTALKCAYQGVTNVRFSENLTCIFTLAYFN